MFISYFGLNFKRNSVITHQAALFSPAIPHQTVKKMGLLDDPSYFQIECRHLSGPYTLQARRYKTTAVIGQEQQQGQLDQGRNDRGELVEIKLQQIGHRQEHE